MSDETKDPTRGQVSQPELTACAKCSLSKWHCRCVPEKGPIFSCCSCGRSPAKFPFMGGMFCGTCAP